MPIMIIAGFLRVSVVTYFAEKSKIAYEKSAQVACEACSSIRTVQSLTRESSVMESYSKLLDGPLRDGFRNAVQNTALYAFSSSFNFAVNAICFYYGGHLMINEGYSLQSFFTVFSLLLFGSSNAARIFANSPDFSKGYEAGSNIINILERTPLIDSRSVDTKKLAPLEGSVSFINTTFSYPTRPDIKVLKGLDVTIKPGQFVAFVGGSGSGKSTTIGLLERFYDAQKGKILVDGKDIKSLPLPQYRSQVSLVSQEPNLFDMTIEENICYGCSDQIYSMEKIVEAAKAANAHDFIMSLPDQYQTRVGSKGGQLSGGQKQRIAIARALIRDPKILLLDEATSALDAESEKIVQDALDNASQGRTTISIAHRLSSIQHADIIFVFRQGRIVEQGSHSELLDRKGIYYELALSQNLQ